MNLPVISFVRLVNVVMNKYFKKRVYVFFGQATTISLNLSTTVSIDQVIVLSFIESGLRLLVFQAGVLGKSYFLPPLKTPFREAGL